MTWRVVSASAIGTSHARAGQTCQDFHCCRLLANEAGHTVLVLVAADGAGSAAQGADGAQLACEMWCSEIEALLQSGGSLREVSQEFLGEWVHHFMREVVSRASANGLRPRDYACTFLTVVLSEQASVFAQIGDGVIVIEDPDHADDYCWVFWPQKGEYENQTHFLTDGDAIATLEYSCERPVQEVVLLTDGLQRLALHFQSRSAYNPFFRPIVGQVRASKATGILADLSAQLQQLLVSDYINNRTDDDKTLIVATRKSADKAAEDEEQL